jgi:hypothetical protein
MCSYPSQSTIPIAILIFENNEIYSYRSYSPANYDVNDNDIDNNEYIYEDLYGQFLANIYNKIARDINQPLNNTTTFGNLKEIHIRYISIPLNQRDIICYFSTYEHPHCRYRPIHRESPINFDLTRAASYENQQPALGHHICSHEFV